jgi:hypothetical protein
MRIGKWVIGGLTGILCPSSYRFFASFLVANARAKNFISSAPDSALKDDREVWPYDASNYGLMTRQIATGVKD